MTRAITCGVLVTNGRRLLIGHAARSPRWDIPKGLAEPGEAEEEAARRELTEETGLAAPGEIEALGRIAYLPQKDLALFVWLTAAMPDPVTLTCRSTFMIAGRPVQELDGFACPAWANALSRLGRGMQAALAPIATARGWLQTP